MAEACGLALSTEMMEIIAEATDRSTLLSMRQASREISNSINHVFLRVFYSHISVLLTHRRSLELAVEAAQDRDKGHAITHITFFLDDITDPVEEISWREGPDELDLGSPIPGLLLDTEPATRLERLLYEVQEEFRDEEEDIRLLNELFSQVKKGKFKRVSFTDSASFDPDETPFPKACSSLEWDLSRPPAPGDQRPLFIVMDALAQNRLRISTLDMSLLAWGLQIDQFARDETVRLRAALRDVECLVLQVFTLLSDDDSDTQANGNQPRMDGFCAFLASLPRLASLSLTNRWDTQHAAVYGELFGARLDWTSLFPCLHTRTFPNLQRLTLYAVDLEWTKLVRFARNHPTLRFLKLDWVGANEEGPEPWDERQLGVFDDYEQTIRRLTNVREVEFGEIFE